MKRYWCAAMLAMVTGASNLAAQEGDKPKDGDRPAREGRPGEGRPEGRPGEGRPEGRPGEGFGRGVPGGREGGPGAFMMRMPIIAALDANQDGEISAQEIDLAVVALKKLDKNGDGKLTADELMPNFEGMGRGGFGGGGFGGGPGGPGGPNPQEMVDRLMESDKDNDGYLVESELPERLRPMLERADTNSDKKLSKDEVAAMVQRQAQAGGGGGFGGRGGFGGGPGRPGGEGGTRRPRPDSE